jgi:hypothetical protein
VIAGADDQRQSQRRQKLAKMRVLLGSTTVDKIASRDDKIERRPESL